MKKFLSVFFLIAGIVAATYLGGFVLFAKPILACCSAFDEGTLTGMMIGITFLKCCVASIVASVCLFVSTLISQLLK